ncbi:competence protein CoiA [Mesobacillus foraminis]|uniref:competence protein CoiA n=1 Tax=Mesobacillus foraminis TaxID=279826 RepID=UPI001BE87F58|nr:competence protein CoiA family protein [Mesobacillus foraminis]MBT2756372.1 competence protein CoiA [Mesobacillus foraminis]
MLVANREDGMKISLGDCRDLQELLQWRSRETFLCPECGTQVILKLGTKRIWHFSHQSGKSCAVENERESAYHMSGKLQLYHWLKEQGISAELEKYIPGCRQRADIALEWNQERYAIEYQCSAISAELFKKRTTGYIENGYIPIWILGGNQLNRMGPELISFNHFQYLFLRKQQGRWQLPIYCPETRQFIILNDILPVSSRKILASLSLKVRHSTFLSDLITPLPKKIDSLASWILELNKLKRTCFVYPGTLQKQLLNELYANRLNLLTLPPEIGLPLASGPYIETPALVWQTFLYIDVFRHAVPGETVSYSGIFQSFTNRLKRRQIMTRDLPQSGQGNCTDALSDYLRLLEKVSFIEKAGLNYFKILRALEVPSSIDDQALKEKNFYDTYRGILIDLL